MLKLDERLLTSDKPECRFELRDNFVSVITPNNFEHSLLSEAKSQLQNTLAACKTIIDLSNNQSCSDFFIKLEKLKEQFLSILSHDSNSELKIEEKQLLLLRSVESVMHSSTAFLKAIKGVSLDDLNIVAQFFPEHAKDLISSTNQLRGLIAACEDGECSKAEKISNLANISSCFKAIIEKTELFYGDLEGLLNCDIDLNLKITKILKANSLTKGVFQDSPALIFLSRDNFDQLLIKIESLNSQVSLCPKVQVIPSDKNLISFEMLYNFAGVEKTITDARKSLAQQYKLEADKLIEKLIQHPAITTAPKPKLAAILLTHGLVEFYPFGSVYEDTQKEFIRTRVKARIPEVDLNNRDLNSALKYLLEKNLVEINSKGTTYKVNNKDNSIFEELISLHSEYSPILSPIHPLGVITASEENLIRELFSFEDHYEALKALSKSFMHLEGCFIQLGNELREWMEFVTDIKTDRVVQERFVTHNELPTGISNSIKTLFNSGRIVAEDRENHVACPVIVQDYRRTNIAHRRKLLETFGTIQAMMLKMLGQYEPNVTTAVKDILDVFSEVNIDPSMSTDLKLVLKSDSQIPEITKSYPTLYNLSKIYPDCRKRITRLHSLIKLSINAHTMNGKKEDGSKS